MAAIWFWSNATLVHAQGYESASAPDRDGLGHHALQSAPTSAEQQAAAVMQSCAQRRSRPRWAARGGGAHHSPCSVKGPSALPNAMGFCWTSSKKSYDLSSAVHPPPEARARLTAPSTAPARRLTAIGSVTSKFVAFYRILLPFSRAGAFFPRCGTASSSRRAQTRRIPPSAAPLRPTPHPPVGMQRKMHRSPTLHPR